MDKPKRIRAQGNSGRCTKQMSKRRYSKKRRNPNKGKKMTSKLVIVEVIVEELVETNQLFTNVNNSLEPITKLTDEVEFIELPKDSVLPSGFRFTDLSILSDVFPLLACPNCLTANTLKLQDIEDKKKGLSRFMQIRRKDCISIAFILLLRLTATKTIAAEE